MSKIEQLINEKCPNGVKYTKLKDLVDYIQPTKYIVKDTKYNDKYNTPVLTAGQTFILGYTNEEVGIYNADKNNQVIIFDDFTTSNHWIDFQFKVKSSAMKILIPKTQDNFKYIYYCIQNIKYIPKEHSRQWIQTFSEFKIPLPPLEVQEEIVKILDKFNKLETELETELETRKKQYKFYKDKIFINGLAKYKFVKLEEIIKSLKTGLNPRKNFVLNTLDAKNYYVTVAEIQNGKIVFLEKTNRINDKALEIINNRSSLEKNDILFSGTGTIGRMAVIREKPCNWNIKEGIYSIKPEITKVLPDYLKFYLSSSIALNIYKDKIVGSPVRSLPMKELKKVRILLPPLEEQERIVKILNKFDKLINDISEGIPAEIEARRKQYEYYRNKLLSFEEIKE